MRPKLTLNVRQEDIDRAVCGNRAKCVLAHALDRSLGLNGSGYIRVDGNRIAYTYEGYRYTFLTPVPAIQYLRKFDELGRDFGETVARELTKPKSFRLSFVDHVRIPPPATEERKAQINLRRNQINAEIRARGEKVNRPNPRYVGV